MPICLYFALSSEIFNPSSININLRKGSRCHYALPITLWSVSQNLMHHVHHMEAAVWPQSQPASHLKRYVWTRPQEPTQPLGPGAAPDGHLCDWDHLVRTPHPRARASTWTAASALLALVSSYILIIYQHLVFCQIRQSIWGSDWKTELRERAWRDLRQTWVILKSSCKIWRFWALETKMNEKWEKYWKNYGKNTKLKLFE